MQFLLGRSVLRQRGGKTPLNVRAYNMNIAITFTNTKSFTVPIYIAQILKLIYLEELHLLGVSNPASRFGCVWKLSPHLPIAL